jgi:hypothetical protein
VVRLLNVTLDAKYTPVQFSARQFSCSENGLGALSLAMLFAIR